MTAQVPIALLLLAACSDYDLMRGKKEPSAATDSADTGDTAPPQGDGRCTLATIPDREVGVGDTCSFSIGSFNPVVEWEAGAGRNVWSTIAVADLDRDGRPELVANFASMFGTGTGYLTVMHGDGSGILWQLTGAALGYADSPAVGDLDGDGVPEIVAVREYQSSLLQTGDYTLAAWSAGGVLLWESEHFTGDDFDYAAAPIISDMDHDGSPEIAVGRVIFEADGGTRGVGAYGRGSFGIMSAGGITMSEGSVAAVADLDLDGTEELIVGDAAYDPDGNALRHDPSQDDALMAVANLDDDPEGETIACSYNTVRAQDTDGSVMWGPLTIPSANILSPAAIGDIDGDGLPEIVVAGGNELWALDRDGNAIWTAKVHDMTGATGASIFDFEGDGVPEVVYIDEIEMVAYDGATGAVKFLSSDHASNTMYDYPVIADVDADGHAEIVVGHAGYSSAMSVYGDAQDSWAPARLLWNQHAYSITNVNDDLSIPVTATPNFTTWNSWHSAIDRMPGEAIGDDVEGEIVDVCDDSCDEGLTAVGRLLNRSDHELPAGIPVTLYAMSGTTVLDSDTATTTSTVAAGWSGEAMRFVIDGAAAAAADDLRLVADDLGTGGGVLSECSETNNDAWWSGPFCR